ncbi:MAG: polyamine ABC transporter, permease protein [Osedax symbiont Rs1]|nr:MAG: polyamine ABC transporter, permease protein [Osedax symbiont Rs1]
MTTNDGVPLKISLQRSQRKLKLWAFLLVAPLLIFITISFILPVVSMTMRGVENPQVANILPNVVDALYVWDGVDLPDEAAYEALVIDLTAGRKNKNIGKVASRLNYERSGMRRVISGSSRKAAKLKEGPYKEQMIKINKAWGDVTTWSLIKRESGAFTYSYLVAAVDYKITDQGDIVAKSEEKQIYKSLFGRTLMMSFTITIICILLAYPIAYLLATLPMAKSNLLMILVLLPFWTSLLVRTTTWIVLLQSNGVLNDILVWMNIIDDSGRLQMIYNQTGTIIAMTHILLPFMVLPLYSVMKTIPPSYMRAALSLGANPVVSYVRVYIPMTVTGIGAGSLLVFILSIGYYITPALVGGQSGVLISNMIAYHMQNSLNWGLAGALGFILLVIVMIFYAIFNKVIGIDKMKMG